MYCVVLISGMRLERKGWRRREIKEVEMIEFDCDCSKVKFLIYD